MKSHLLYDGGHVDDANLLRKPQLIDNLLAW